VPLVRCATHGDFSPANLAMADGRLKVLDWEWSGMNGSPCFDLWTYQLAELHSLMAAGRMHDFDRQMDDALCFVESELEIAGVDRRFALALLPATLSELVFRFRRTLGRVGLWELVSGDLMASVERLMNRQGYALSSECAILGALSTPS
jgi:aminoglycoside phosphotransferase (APT) family kinase protein